MIPIRRSRQATRGSLAAHRFNAGLPRLVILGGIMLRALLLNGRDEAR
jgi:hypothetical protein